MSSRRWSPLQLIEAVKRKVPCLKHVVAIHPTGKSSTRHSEHPDGNTVRKRHAHVFGLISPSFRAGLQSPV